jgi:NADPH-dependent glutamate synthase beta subunit-like oxidoreductase
MRDAILPENLLRSGYKDCLLCEVERKGEENRCRRCSGRLEQRDRLLWEIHRARIRRSAARLSLVYPGLGHFYGGRFLPGIFWGSLIPLSLWIVVKVWKGPTPGHAVLLLAFGLIWYLARLDAGRGFAEETAPCRLACPVSVDAPNYIALVREGRPLEALALVHDRLPFAAFCGRACPHPCERQCVRNEFDAPISIMAIKRYAADLGYGAGIPPSPAVGEGAGGPKVAVIGAGPAGLSAADTLARLGSRVTVFDRCEEPGGMLRYAVADFRYPRGALEQDVRTILARGVVFSGGKRFGRDVTFQSLGTDGFDAVLIAVGTGIALTLPGAEGEAAGFFDALSFLEAAKRDRPTVPEGRVVVIGGGNVAMDVARVAIRLGAEDLTIVCLESRETMPAFQREVEDALAEGARLLSGVAVKKFLFREGRVAGIEAIRVERIAFDPHGRILPQMIPGSEFEVPADTVILAIGSRPGLDFPDAVFTVKPVDPLHHVSRLIFGDERNTIPAYMCGDCVSGPSTVVEASASGRAAALNIFGEIRVEEVRKARYRDNYRRAAEPQLEDRPEWRMRLPVSRMPPERSRGCFHEVEQGYDESTVRREAERCARCNLWL